MLGLSGIQGQERCGKMLPAVIGVCVGFQAEKLTVADINDDDACESIAGEDRMPLLRVSIAGSEASIEMGEGRAQAGGFSADFCNQNR